jgi:hypothetical protein
MLRLGLTDDDKTTCTRNAHRTSPQVACSVHKWLGAPYGCSLLFVARALHDGWVGLEHHERNREGSDHPNWDALGAMGARGYPDVYKGGARRFDAGGRPNPV